ncbi:PREDICTED: uncharacterized protein LOC105141426 isoform X6 [Populus euphratica]|uniref:Uncharacterized protein LOC105141426 isoform X6 n=1 Tax=Populus euphratica TaxID=75702 RepID=A0AAJ6VFH9_POPEU|nr:PREDICTED: uncharacterized protein LOC105141426 isoform X6 [Populus euphratica]
MNTRSSWADLASNSADKSTNAGSSANNGSVGTAGNAPTRSIYVPPHLRNRAPSSDPPAAAFSGPASSNDRPGYGGGSRWGVPRNDYRGGYGSDGGRGGLDRGRGGWDRGRGREREVNPFGSDRASARLGGFQRIKASNKGVIVLKDGVDGHSVRLGGFQGVKSSNKGVIVLKDESDGASVKLGAFLGARASNKGVAVLTEDTNSVAVLGSFKILSYNVWFREDLEMHRRMKALGELIQLHSPDVICLQEVIPDIYDIFQRSSWWKAYQCSVSSEIASSRGYFCMQLSKLPVKSFSTKPFMNSIMGRELCIAELEVPGKKSLVVATSHLESPCPAPPKWDQMFSKERVDQAKEAINLLKKNSNVIFCGDMNWDDKLDGQFPFPDGWVDAWVELKPGDNGWTYDTKSNQMLSGNRALQKRLDRFICSLCDFKISKIDMIGKDAIPGLSYMKEKKVRKEVKMLELPVLPSDHYGLLLTVSGL